MNGRNFSGCADEYDKALVFALKKWISDEIFSITESGVSKAAVCWQKEDGKALVSFEYTVNDSSEPCSGGLLDGNNAVTGSVDIWLDFKGYDVSKDEEAAADNFGMCVLEAAARLESDGIIKERFGRSVPIDFRRI